MLYDFNLWPADSRSFLTDLAALGCRRKGAQVVAQLPNGTDDYLAFVENEEGITGFHFYHRTFGELPPTTRNKIEESAQRYVTAPRPPLFPRRF